MWGSIVGGLVFSVVQAASGVLANSLSDGCIFLALKMIGNILDFFNVADYIVRHSYQLAIFWQFWSISNVM